MRTVISFVIGVFVVLAMAIPAEAQYYRDYRVEQLRDAIGGYDRQSIYGGRDTYGYRDPRMTDPCYGADQFYQGVRGTIHAHDGKMHFRPCDPTNGQIGTVAGGALGAGAGAAIGGAFGGRKGAATGAVGVGIVGGVIASKNAHDNCIFMESAQAVQTSQTFQPSMEMPTSYQEQVQRPVDSIERKLIRNRFEEAEIRVYEGSKRVLELAAGNDGEVEVTSSSRIWGEAHLENPKNGKMEWIPLQLGRGIDNLPENAGWVFGNPNTRPSLQ